MESTQKTYCEEHEMCKLIHYRTFQVVISAYILPPQINKYISYIQGYLINYILK